MITNLTNFLSFANPAEKTAFIEKLERFSILGILFFIPISPAAPNLLGLLLIVLWFLKGQYQASWLSVKSQPIFWAFLVYLLLNPVSLLWSDNQEWGVHMVERHMLYLLFPFMLMAAKREDIKYYLAAYIFGITFTEIVSYLMWFDLLHLTDVAHEGEPVPFYHHVEYNPMLAWGIYLLMHGLFFEKHSLKLKAFFAFFVVTMTINMFITGGRGGQITYFLVVFVLFMQYFSLKGQLLKGLILSFGFLAVVFTLAYQSSALFKDRVDMAIHEVQTFSPSSNGSVASRLHMYINTSAMSFDRPVTEMLIGTGVGDFPEVYNQFVGTTAPFQMTADKTGHSHPHNMYLYQLGALGLLGLASLLVLFLAFAKVALEQRDQYMHHRWAFIIFILAIMVSDSLLLAHPTSVLFIAFSAILFLPLSKKDEMA